MELRTVVSRPSIEDVQRVLDDLQFEIDRLDDLARCTSDQERRGQYEARSTALSYAWSMVRAELLSPRLLP